MQEDKKKEENKKKSVDRSALVAAVGLMCLSWVALPFVYLLIVKLRKKEKKGEKIQEQKNEE